MLDFKLNNLQLAQRIYSNLIQTQDPEEKVKLLIIRDLLRLDWRIEFKGKKITIAPPSNYDKHTIKESMAIKRNERVKNDLPWVNKNIALARSNLADGSDIMRSQIEPEIEVCVSSKQHALFRILRYYWSSPYSDYVDRRIKLLVRDKGLSNKPIIGIAALGSSIIHIPDRDDWIGWNKATRTKNIIYTMDSYVIGALPPYSYLLGGKLISYILASNEVRDIFRSKYASVETQNKRIANDLVCLFTTSLYGKSSQYNRIRLDNNELYIPIGETKGFGTFHLTQETFNAMLEYLKAKGVYIANNFGDGPSWSMRVIRAVGNLIKFDSDFLLKHSFKRQIYATPLATNFKEYLLGIDKEPYYCDYPLDYVVTYWKARWYTKRVKNNEAINMVESFNKNQFTL